MQGIAVGVDAGGSKTAVAHSIDGKIKTVVSGAGANASAHGAQRASATIAETIERALAGARPDAIFVGAAGAGRPDVAECIQRSLQARFGAARIVVRDDAFVAFRAAIPEGDGVLLIAGTGSIVYAERAGVEYRAGGHGYLFGDEGSAFAIGNAAIKQLLRAYDGRVARDAMMDEIEAHFNAKTQEDVLGAVYGAESPAGAVAAVAPAIVALAANGNRSATTIVQRAALELAELAKAIVKRAGLTGSSAPIAFAGGLLSANSLLTYLLETRLLNDLPGMPIQKAPVDPCAGALRAAQAML